MNTSTWLELERLQSTYRNADFTLRDLEVSNKGSSTSSLRDISNRMKKEERERFNNAFTHITNILDTRLKLLIMAKKNLDIYLQYISLSKEDRDAKTDAYKEAYEKAKEYLKNYYTPLYNKHSLYSNFENLKKLKRELDDKDKEIIGDSYLELNAMYDIIKSKKISELKTAAQFLLEKTKNSMKNVISSYINSSENREKNYESISTLLDGVNKNTITYDLTKKDLYKNIYNRYNITMDGGEYKQVKRVVKKPVKPAKRPTIVAKPVKRPTIVAKPVKRPTTVAKPVKRPTTLAKRPTKTVAKPVKRA